MDDIDPDALADALLRLMQQRSAPSTARPDRHGWFAIGDLCVAASDVLDREVVTAHVRHIGRRGARFEVSGTRIRLVRRGRRRRPHRGPPVPDILFHATTADAVDAIRAEGALVPGPHRSRVVLSANETQAWRAAHRLSGVPEVLAVDGVRARRGGARFQRLRQGGLFAADRIPLHHILSLREGFDLQLSAGGIPVRRDADGTLRMALIRVTRRSGTTWEVAKGKLEVGETPERAAVREVQEEMGVEVDLSVIRYVDEVRYGFLAPGGLPRLKSIFLYLMVPHGEMQEFLPAEAEGIGDVAWFTVDEAVRAVTHTSLKPVMRRARDLVRRYGLTPAHDVAPSPGS